MLCFSLFSAAVFNHIYSRLKPRADQSGQIRRVFSVTALAWRRALLNVARANALIDQVRHIRHVEEQQAPRQPQQTHQPPIDAVDPAVGLHFLAEDQCQDESQSNTSTPKKKK